LQISTDLKTLSDSDRILQISTDLKMISESSIMIKPLPHNINRTPNYFGVQPSKTIPTTKWFWLEIWGRQE
jgi:hypothetical protein